MSTKIYNTTTKKVHELSLIDSESGQDFLSDVIGGCNQSGEWLDGIPEDRDDVDYAMDDEQVSWWERWAKREQRINDACAEADEDTRNRVLGFYNDYDWDMELPQQKAMELLDLED